MSSPSRRRDTDVMKLLMSDYKVELNGDIMSDFNVDFHGPKDSPYEGGVWRVHVALPEGYPYKSPSIGFLNKMYHPNVDELSGSVCLDVINQTWSPMFDLVNIFEVFLPQLLLYPNPTDPLNGEAAALLMREPETYRSRVKEFVAKFARDAAIHSDGGGGGGEQATAASTSTDHDAATVAAAAAACDSSDSGSEISMSSGDEDELEMSDLEDDGGATPMQ